MLYFFIIINIDVQASLNVPRLISHALKLMIMQASSDHYISNHMTRTWNHMENKSFDLRFLLLDHLLYG